MIKLPKNFLLKTFFISIFVFLFITFYASSVSAYIPVGSGGGGNVYYDQFKDGLKSDSWEKSSFDFTTVNNIMESISTNIVGTGNADIDQRLGQTALGTTTNLIAQLYRKSPASSVEYFADLGNRLKIIKPTYAQGIGYEGLKPVLDIWTTFRNISYLLFIVIFVFIGFATMFRLKINPQVVVTVQNALPKIIITLILITFSYAIAGLMIDLIYVVISLFANLLDIPILYNHNLFGLVQDMLGGFKATAETLGESIEMFIDDITVDFVGWITGSLAKLIFSVALLFSIFKLFFTLIIAYIGIIAGVLFSPLMLILEAIPGQKGLMNWLKMMMTNIIPFIITGVVFMIGGRLVTASQGGEIWVGPFLGLSETEAYLPSLIGFAIILALPSVISSVQKSIGTPGIAGIAGGVIAPITGAWGAIRGATVGAYQSGRQVYGMTGFAQRKQEEHKILAQARGRANLENKDIIDKKGQLI
jgi:hypothetical protein